MDRVSAFSDPETVELLSTRYVPVGISLTELIKSQDPEGDFFRKITDQRHEPPHTKQGYYICAPDGKLIRGWMYPRPDDGTMRFHLREEIAEYKAPAAVEPIDGGKVDRQCNPAPPEGAVVVETAAKILEAKWGPSPHPRVEMIRASIGRDRLWILNEEVAALAQGRVPESLLHRIARFHLVDNTRGVPARWPREAVKEAGLTLKEGGRVRLEEKGRRFDARIEGTIEVRDGKLVRFDLLARGAHAEEKASVGEVPQGDATLAVAFRLAEAGESSRVPPLYSWDLPDYLK